MDVTRLLLLAGAAIGAILLGELRDGPVILVALASIVAADVATEFHPPGCVKPLLTV